ncbi:putative bifunctional diguanylate cyclase/phosphodiesterase [Nakamurella endophytica]|uniref:putative bifunctional diguanylate cyclase/phosphodiesterase n=1 Tax=Nakamurella endophytica TaxID=1748367 RepID=UPI001664AEF8|nr:bifunctional diguanylate cyclase/phosphodiesterase [Nakamurella endophytica]
MSPARPRAAMLYGAAGVVVAAGYAAVPDGLPQDAVYLAVGLSCLAAVTVGLSRQPRAARPTWRALQLGLLLWVLGDTLSSWFQDVAHLDAYPTWADACYLAAYPVLTVGLWRLVRSRLADRDTAGLLDSAILTAGLGLLSWVVLARPTLAQSSSAPLAAVVGVAYPVGDIVLLAVLIRLLTTPGGRTPAFRLLFAGAVLLVAADTTTTALGLWTSTATSVPELLWLLSYVAWGAAALHPSAARLAERSVEPRRPFSRRRLVALLAAGLVAPGVLLAQWWTGSGIDAAAIAVGWVLLFLLVVARMRLAVRQVVAAHRERDRLQGDLAFQAAHDFLTHLPNRAQAMAGIEAALGRAQRTGDLLGLLFLDLDGFKAVNDSLGHRAGDEVLRAVADRLRRAVRVGDLVARLGGDEFVVLLESLPREADAVQLAHRLVRTVGEPVQLSGAVQAAVGVSIGVAIGQDGSTDPDRLLHEADTAAYRAKRAGRGRVEVFDDALRTELDLRADLERDLRHAIDADELVLHYQPVVDLSSGAVQGYEALVRWQRPGHGLVPPLEFIPVAEESSLICELDAWVLHRATAQMAAWGHHDRTVSVNVSGRHVSDPRIVDDVRSALARSGLSPAQLALEITETVVIEDLRAPHHLRQLRELGVAVTLDDFGTGYHSLASLRDLPVDTLKIDRSFLDTGTRSSRALLELMITAAHAFDLPVVAEGVETPDQVAALRAMRCESAQGFHLGRPLTVSQVEALAAGPGQERSSRGSAPAPAAAG